MHGAISDLLMGLSCLGYSFYRLKTVRLNLGGETVVEKSDIATNTVGGRGN